MGNGFTHKVVLSNLVNYIENARFNHETHKLQIIHSRGSHVVYCVLEHLELRSTFEQEIQVGPFPSKQ